MSINHSITNKKEAGINEKSWYRNDNEYGRIFAVRADRPILRESVLYLAWERESIIIIIVVQSSSSSINHRFHRHLLQSIVIIVRLSSAIPVAIFRYSRRYLPIFPSLSSALPRLVFFSWDSLQQGPGRFKIARPRASRPHAKMKSIL